MERQTNRRGREEFFSAGSADHVRLRRAFATAFAESAVREYEGVARRDVGALVEVLREKVQKGGGRAAADLVQWTNFAAYDAISDLGWRETFKLLETGSYHPYVTITLGTKAPLAGTRLAYYPPLDRAAQSLMAKAAREGLDMLLRTTRENVRKRLDMKTEWTDVFAHVVDDTKDAECLERAGISRGELEMNSMSISAAGSEPITIAVCGLFNHLLRNPGRMQTLRRAVVDAAAEMPVSEFSGAGLAGSPYLNPCLKEALTLCPAFPDGLRRLVDTPVTIAGQFIPTGTVVSVPCLAAFTSPANFERADAFIPERWLSSPVVEGGQCAKDFPGNRKEAFQPFSYGARNCLGQNLAWLEMRLFVAALVEAFDVRVPKGEEVRPWEQQNVYWTWEKEGLSVELRESEMQVWR